MDSRFSGDEVAQQLGINRRTLYSWCDHLGIDHSSRRAFTGADIQRLREFQEAGGLGGRPIAGAINPIRRRYTVPAGYKTIAELVQETGLSLSGVHRLRKRLGIGRLAADTPHAPYIFNPQEADRLRAAIVPDVPRPITRCADCGWAGTDAEWEGTNHWGTCPYKD